MKNKVCLFFNREYVDAHYCFRELAVQFAERGFEVDLFMDWQETHPVPYFESDRVRIYLMQHSLKDVFKFFVKAVLQKKYDVIVATPQWALYWAVLIGRMAGTPVVCLSDEVAPNDGSKWKRREAWAHRQCLMTIALGEERHRLAIERHELPKGHPYAIIPNAPAGRAQRLKSHFYRDMLGIPDYETLLLHSGGLGWTLLPPLIESAKSWPKEFTLLVQNRLQNKDKASSDRVRYSIRVLPSQLMPHATSSADIGLMLYNQQHAGEAQNGNTAGKLGLYLSCGLPLICCNLEILKWVEKEGCGIWVSDVSQVLDAARRIMSNYDAYSRASMRVFNERYEYSKNFKVFFEQLQKLISR